MAKVRKRTWTTAGGKTKTAWVADVTIAGKRSPKQFKTKREADAYLAQHTMDKIRGGLVAPNKRTVAEACETWLEACKAGRDGARRLERGTLAFYEGHVRLHIVPRLGHVRLQALEVAHLKHLVENLEGSPAHKSRVLTSLGSAIGNAKVLGWTARNVVNDYRAETKKHTGSSRRHQKRLEVGVHIPTPDQVRRILEASRDPWRPIIVTAAFTGLRSSELRGLRWSDVDFEANELGVTQRADKFNALGDPKSADSQRKVPLAPIVRNTLRAWKLPCPPSDHDLVFPRPTGEVHWQKDIYKSCFGRANKDAGLCKYTSRPTFGPHSFRHFAASMFIAKGCSPKRVQALMGHASIQITFDTYGHLFPSPEDDAAMMQAIETTVLEAVA